MTNYAIFAGGCFWCLVKPFTGYEGIEDIICGYTGGEIENPSYSDVCSGKSGHYEAVMIKYDDELIGYEDLLNIFWKQIDPFDDSGQFADRGTQYKTAIFYCDEKQKEVAEKSMENIEKMCGGSKIATQILPQQPFYVAEDNHQYYYRKNPNHYSVYYRNSGRYNFIKSHWDRHNIDREELQKKLTSLQFEVTQNDMTEVPFENDYFNNFEKGIYVDVVNGQPLFLSNDKYEADCGWPCFTKPIKDILLTRRMDYSFGMLRTEVRTMQSNIHLGHVYDDGPVESGGARYCINSASLKFIPYDKMDECGYGMYKEMIK